MGLVWTRFVHQHAGYCKSNRKGQEESKMKFPVETIRAFGEAVAVKAGMTPENAVIFIDNMISADLRNVRSHGITKFRGYLSRVEHGASDITAEPTIVKTAPATL